MPEEREIDKNNKNPLEEKKQVGDHRYINRCKVVLDTFVRIIQYDLCSNTKEGGENFIKHHTNIEWEYIGKGILFDSDGVPQNSTVEQYFWKRKPKTK